MEKLFATVLSLSFTGSLVIMAVLAARLVLKKAPKILSYALWAVVLVRLVCPISFSSPYYGVPQNAPVSFDNLIEYEATMHAAGPDASPIQPQAAAATISPMFVLSLVWAAGVAAMLIYGIFTYVRLRRKLVGAVRLKDNIYLADYLETPFVLGFVRPKIYLPSGMDEWEKPYILAHEQHHIRRLDYLAKPVGFFALCLHWFNPLVWLAFVLFCKDMEMSCDEAVIKKLGNNARADYAAALLNLATGRKIIAGMPLAFGEGDTKNRIQNMKSWKKPVFWIVTVAAIGCAVLAAFLLTDKKEDNPQAALVSSIHYENQNILFTIPKGAENPEEWTIQIYGRAEYPDGMTMSRHYLEGTVWEAGKEYSIDVSNAEALTDLSMYLSNQETEKEIDLMEYLPHSESAGKDTISAAQIGDEILVDMTFQNAPAAQLSFTLPKGITLGEAFDEPGDSGYLLKDESGNTVGDFFLMGIAADSEDLKQVDTGANQLPMQVFAGAALPNHVMYEDYQVQTSTATGAAATALFSSQNLDLMDEYGSAAAIPFDNRKNLVLYYDYEKLPVFLQIGFAETAVSQPVCAEIAKSVQIKPE